MVPLIFGAVIFSVLLLTRIVDVATLAESDTEERKKERQRKLVNVFALTLLTVVFALFAYLLYQAQEQKRTLARSAQARLTEAGRSFTSRMRNAFPGFGSRSSTN